MSTSSALTDLDASITRLHLLVFQQKICVNQQIKFDDNTTDVRTFILYYESFERLVIEGKSKHGLHYEFPFY